MNNKELTKIILGVLLFAFLFVGLGYSLGKRSRTIFVTIEKCSKTWEQQKYENYTTLCKDGIKKFDEHLNFPIVECK